MCQVQAGAYVSLLTPGGTKYSDCHPSKTTTYILHVVSITTHTHDRHKSIGEIETKKMYLTLINNKLIKYLKYWSLQTTNKPKMLSFYLLIAVSKYAVVMKNKIPPLPTRIYYKN